VFCEFTYNVSVYLVIFFVYRLFSLFLLGRKRFVLLGGQWDIIEAKFVGTLRAREEQVLA